MKSYIVLILLFFTFGCNLPFRQASFYLPSDAEMKSNFLKNEAGFNKLVQMYGAEGSSVSFIGKGKNEIWLHKEISDERWNEYQKLFDQVDATYGMDNYNDFDGQRPITFFISSKDLSGQWNKEDYDEFFTGVKGYAYSQNELKPSVDSLDYIRDAQLEKNRYLFKKIKGNWYIYYTIGSRKPE